MTAEILDIGIIALIVLSAMIGLMYGFIKEGIFAATLVAAFGFVWAYMTPLAAQLPPAVHNEVVRLGIAGAIIFFSVLVVGTIVNHLLSSAVSAIGLGGVDHLLGGVFGVLRGGLIITLLVMLFGVTNASKQVWWQNSIFMPWFEDAANTLKGVIPQDFSNYLGHPPATLPH